MAQVFISYSRKDLTFVEHLISDLKKTGIDVWYDLSGLEGGSRWGTEIKNAIQNSDYVIVVLSPDSIASEWVEREYLLSDNLKKKILPLMYRECDLPLSFLNLNYVDVQGDNYTQNFDKITRFLSTTPSAPLSPATATPLKKPAATPRGNSQFYALLGAMAVLGLAAVFFLSNRPGPKTISDVNNTTTPVETLVQPTASLAAGTILVMETPSPLQPNVALTATSIPLDVMVTSGPTQADTSALAVYVEYAASKNMSAQYALLTNDHAMDPSVLVFATSNFGSNEVRNIRPIGVRFTESQKWAIRNQDAKAMPHGAAFNIQLLREGQDAFMDAFFHKVALSNSSQHWTAIDEKAHPLASSPDTLVFAISNWTPPGGSMRPNTVDIGVRYEEGQWVIANQDPRYPMPVGAAFNVLLVTPSTNAFVHTATGSNTAENYTVIDENPALALDRSKLVFVMPRIPSAVDGIYNDQPIGVWYSSDGWAIFNQDENIKMPVGAQFNILILDESVDR